MLCPWTEHNPSWVVWYLLGTTDMGPGQGRDVGKKRAIPNTMFHTSFTRIHPYREYDHTISTYGASNEHNQCFARESAAFWESEIRSRSSTSNHP